MNYNIRYPVLHCVMSKSFPFEALNLKENGLQEKVDILGSTRILLLQSRKGKMLKKRKLPKIRQYHAVKK